MNKTEWSRMALLSARKTPTKRGNLMSCVRDFLALSEDQQNTARIVVPECIRINGGAALRSISGKTLATLATMLPVQAHSISR